MNRKWYLSDDYPRWFRAFKLEIRFKKLFQAKVFLMVVNVLLVFTVLGSFFLLSIHGRVLVRGLGYW
jgi:hypothetical protein